MRREFESEAPAAEGKLKRIVRSREQFQKLRESDDGNGTFSQLESGDRELQTAGAMMLYPLDWKLILVAG